jgi:hypothetical protein
MAWTKQQLIEQAYGELALAGFVFDLDAEVLENALRILDTMMAEWLELRIDVGYLLPSTPEDSNIGDDAGLPYSAGATVWRNLAVRLAAGHGKNLTAQTIATATSGYNRLLGTAVAPAPGELPCTARIGAGNKPWRGM